MMEEVVVLDSDLLVTNGDAAATATAVVITTGPVEPLTNGTGDAQQEQQTGDQPAAQQGGQGGEAVIGRHLRKRFGRKFYSGTVAEFEADTNWYKVIYEDGDGEELEWKELEPLLISDEQAEQASKKRRAGASAAKSGGKKRKTKPLEEVERAEVKAAQGGHETETTEAPSTDQPSEQEAEKPNEEQVPADEPVEEEPAAEKEAEPETAAEIEPETPEPGAEEVVAKPETKKGRGKKAAAEKTQDTKGSRATRKRDRPAQTTGSRKSARLTGGTTPVSGVVSTSKRKRGGESPKQAGSAKAKAKRGTPSAAAKGKQKSSEEEEEEEEDANKYTPQDRGQKLKGRKLEKEFDGKAYAGEITGYDRAKKYYKIHYEDGDEEEMEWKEVGPLLIPLENETAAQEKAETSAAQGRRPVTRGSSKGSVKAAKTLVRKAKGKQTKKPVTRSTRPR